MEIKYRNKRITLEERVEIVKDYNKGLPIAKIMEKYSTSMATIYRVLGAMAKKEV